MRSFITGVHRGRVGFAEVWFSYSHAQVQYVGVASSYSQAHFAKVPGCARIL